LRVRVTGISSTLGNHGQRARERDLRCGGVVAGGDVGDGWVGKDRFALFAETLGASSIRELHHSSFE
jgi:hypothetical protein